MQFQILPLYSFLFVSSILRVCSVIWLFLCHCYSYVECMLVEEHTCSMFDHDYLGICFVPFSWLDLEYYLIQEF